ncbi:MAG: valine--tRNA ligase [Bacteroidota bacterium]
MEIPSKYDPKLVEDKWNQHWLENRLFHSVPDERESYSVVIPPPNVTGVLHMGHMLNNTIQDVCVRRARMLGKNACWVPGTDHASIATEAKVVQLLRKQGIRKSDLSREAFLEHAFEWKEKYGGIILDQLKKLGASVDWDRTSFTMDPGYYKAVTRVFVDLYNKGYIYRGLRMINWDCEAQTALSNEEVLYNEDGDKSLLYHVRYAIKDSNDSLVIATQRPETIMGDTAIAVNPTDERFLHLIGKMAIVPMIGREIPIIADEYVEKDFGTGCLKVTPAHDPNDYELGQRHNLPVIDTINLDGTLNASCEIPEFVGKERFEVRQLVIDRLKASGELVKEEEFMTRIGRSERTNTVVEPKLSLQWFIRMKDISKQALDAVENDEITLHPAKFKNTYRHWMENVRDWCISRQLWWGHRIPAFYYGEGENDFVVAETREEAEQIVKQRLGENTTAELRQDDDVLDTWASSWLWPIAVFDGFNDNCFDKTTGKINKKANKELDYYYPTQVLVTAPEILFFWVARMIIAGYEYLDEKPFSDVYLHGIVRDKQGRKMSKSLGNSPDPLDLMATYGADGTRVGMLLSSPAGNDLLFDEGLCEQGRNFSNKIWNAFRLVNGWESADIPQPESARFAIEWFESKFSETIGLLNQSYDKFRISEALMTTYKLVWDDFCAWYLEMVKPAYQQPIDSITLTKTKQIFENILKVLHPFMPFITEEIWHYLGHRETAQQSCCLAEWPKTGAVNSEVLAVFNETADIIIGVRTIRLQNNIPNKEQVELKIKDSGKFAANTSTLIKMCGVSNLETITEKAENSFTFISNQNEFFVPFGENVDVEAELKKLEDELVYTKGFLDIVLKKLNNEKFVAGAPAAVIDNERKKQADAEGKIRMLEEKISALIS